MKRFYTTSVFLFSVVFCFAGKYFGQNIKLYNGDTINFTDANQLKQGLWIYFNSMKHLPDYKPDQIVEKGHYKDSRKNGVWEKYFPTGDTESVINYLNNRPNGHYIIYYPNGKIQEEGNWKNNRNIGSFKRYYDNGKVSQDFNFANTGKRQGEQKYYYDNGQLMIDGNWDGGKKSGIVKNYYENGDLKAEKDFEDGKLDSAKTKIYQPTKPLVKTNVVEDAPVKKVMAKKTEKPNIGSFNGNGYAKLYNLNKQIIKDGTFKNYRLMTGKAYIYDNDGILQDIEVFKRGHLIGHAPIDEKTQQ